MDSENFWKKMQILLKISFSNILNVAKSSYFEEMVCFAIVSQDVFLDVGVYYYVLYICISIRMLGSNST